MVDPWLIIKAGNQPATNALAYFVNDKEKEWDNMNTSPRRVPAWLGDSSNKFTFIWINILMLLTKKTESIKRPKLIDQRTQWFSFLYNMENITEKVFKFHTPVS